MDNIKMPFLPEETLRTQRVEVYLNDLKVRLKQLRYQHDEVIQHSVDIIKEIDGVSSSLLLTPNGEEQNEQITKIKKLIQEFEEAQKTTATKTSTPPIGLENSVDIRKILEDFEKLNDSHVLKDSLVLFKRAKESFQKIDTFLDKIPSSEATSESSKDNASGGGGAVCPNLKHKIDIFNGIIDRSPDCSSRYSSCCSSNVSIIKYCSNEELAYVKRESANKTEHSNNFSEKGYEGDNDDSEYDLLAAKKKKTKCFADLKSAPTTK